MSAVIVDLPFRLSKKQYKRAINSPTKRGGMNVFGIKYETDNGMKSVFVDQNTYNKIVSNNQNIGRKC